MGNYLNKIIALFLIFSFLGLFLIFSLFWYFSNDLPDFGFLKTYKPPVSTKVYDIDGDVIADFSRERRSFVKIDQVPKRVINAFLSAEDKNFYEHPGIDAIGITRAVIKNVQNIISGNRLEGASTITQQVAKNFLLTSDVSLARKVKEAILAFRIEKVLSKKRILELYLNEIYLGERSYGIASASMTYFDKSIKDINNAEAALLASLPKAPSKYNPYRNFNTVKGRKDWVLKRMQDNGFISKGELQKSLNYKIKLKKRDLNIDTSPTFFVEEVRKNLIEQYGDKQLYRQGLFVKTSLNKKIQKVTSSALKKNIILYSKRHGWTGPLYKNYTREKFNQIKKNEKLKSRHFNLALVENVDQNKVQRLYEKDDFDIDELIAVDDLTEIHAYVIQLQNIDIDSMTCIFYINKCLSFCKEYLEYRSYNLTTVESKILAKVQEIILNLLLIKDTNISMNASIDVSTLMSSLAHTHHILNLRKYESIV